MNYLVLMVFADGHHEPFCADWPVPSTFGDLTAVADWLARNEWAFLNAPQPRHDGRTDGILTRVDRVDVVRIEMRLTAGAKAVADDGSVVRGFIQSL